MFCTAAAAVFKYSANGYIENKVITSLSHCRNHRHLLNIHVFEVKITVSRSTTDQMRFCIDLINGQFIHRSMRCFRFYYCWFSNCTVTRSISSYIYWNKWCLFSCHSNRSKYLCRIKTKVSKLFSKWIHYLVEDFVYFPDARWVFF